MSFPAKVLLVCSTSYCCADRWIRRQPQRFTKRCREMTRPDVCLLALMCTSSLGVLPYATHRLPLGTGPRPRKLCAAFSFSATNKLIRRLASASCASRANPRPRKQKVRKSVKKLLQGGANLASRKRWVSHTPARCVRQPCLTKNQAGLLSARTGTSPARRAELKNPDAFPRQGRITSGLRSPQSLVTLGDRSGQAAA